MLSLLEGDDNERLWKVLRISYDILHKNEQDMFLDIACFFCDSARYGERTLLRIWGGNSVKSIELRNLKERRLVKVNKEDGPVTMHDQLRDIGRSVGQSQGVLDQMTRLWDCKDGKMLLQNNEIISTQIQGLSLEHWRVESASFSIFKWKGLILKCLHLRLLNLHMVDKNIIEAITIKGSSSIQCLCLKGNITKVLEFV